MFTKLKYRNKEYKNNKDIISIIRMEGMFWLLDSEVLNANIEIINNTLIWHDGDFLRGKWYYGIFKGGTFHGTFENGIFEGGEFKGEFISGINKSTKI